MNLHNVWCRLFNKTRGRFFTVEFVKADGSLRVLNGKLSKAVSMDLIDSSGHIVVWDAQKRAFRKINLSTIRSFRCKEISL